MEIGIITITTLQMWRLSREKLSDLPKVIETTGDDSRIPNQAF